MLPLFAEAPGINTYSEYLCDKTQIRKERWKAQHELGGEVKVKQDTEVT